MTTPRVIRRARPGDATALLRVIRAAFAEYRGRLDPPSSAEGKTLEAVRGEMAEGAAFVAEAGAEVVGCVMARERDGAWYWDRLSVLPAHRGAGIGRRLVAAAEAEGRARGLATATLSVRLALEGNHRYYEALGYRRVGYGTHQGYDRPTFQIMEKALEPGPDGEGAQARPGAAPADDGR